MNIEDYFPPLKSLTALSPTKTYDYEISSCETPSKTAECSVRPSFVKLGIMGEQASYML